MAIVGLHPLYSADIIVTSITTSAIDAAINQANATTASDRILFNISGTGFRGRVVASTSITQPLVIDGSTLTGYQKYFPVLELVLPNRDTSKALTIKGIVFNIGYLANSNFPNTIKNNLTFVDCNVFKTLSYPDETVLIKNVKNITFRGCVFSASLFTSKSLDKDHVFERISVVKCSNIVFGGTGPSEANVIFGFWKKGVFIYKSYGIQFNSNYIGVLPKELASVPITNVSYVGNSVRYVYIDGQDGIYICQSSGIVVGGDNDKQGCVIGGMYTNGVYLINSRDITIKNNLIGVSESGDKRADNLHGVTSASLTGTEIGGGSPPDSDADTNTSQYTKMTRNVRILNNVISGNRIHGIQLANTDSVLIAGNKVGLGKDGKTNLGNGWSSDAQYFGTGDGVNLYQCTRVYIGGTMLEKGVSRTFDGNTIGFNQNGVWVSECDKIYMEKNNIGVNTTFNLAIPNVYQGIGIVNKSTNVRVGSLTSPNYLQNIIAGNGSNGILISGTNTQKNIIGYNTIGVNSMSGGANKRYGIEIRSNAKNNFIGSKDNNNANFGNLFENNVKGHIFINSGAVNNMILLNQFRDGSTLYTSKYIQLDLGGSNPGNYSSQAPTIVSIEKNSATTLLVKGSSVLASEHISLYLKYNGGVYPIKRTLSSSKAWEMTIGAEDASYVYSILNSGLEGVFVALASCSDNCQGAFNDASTLNHNTSEFSPEKRIKINTYDCVGCIESFHPKVLSKYILSAWVKEENGQSKATYDKGGIKVAFNNNTLQPQTYYPKGQIIDGWQRVEESFSVPGDAADIEITLLNEGASNVFYDDIRIHPLEGEMRSYVYDPFSKKLVAELDENNYATLYEYDKEGILVRVKKETERGVYTIKESKSHQAQK